MPHQFPCQDTKGREQVKVSYSLGMAGHGKKRQRGTHDYRGNNEPEQRKRLSKEHLPENVEGGTNKDTERKQLRGTHKLGITEEMSGDTKRKKAT